MNLLRVKEDRNLHYERGQGYKQPIQKTLGFNWNKALFSTTVVETGLNLYNVACHFWQAMSTGLIFTSTKMKCTSIDFILPALYKAYKYLDVIFIELKSNFINNHNTTVAHTNLHAK